MIYSYKDASREEGKLIDDYGEPITRNVLTSMNGCWKSGFWTGVAVAFTPGLMLFVAGMLK